MSNCSGYPCDGSRDSVLFGLGCSWGTSGPGLDRDTASQVTCLGPVRALQLWTRTAIAASSMDVHCGQKNVSRGEWAARPWVGQALMCLCRGRGPEGEGHSGRLTRMRLAQPIRSGIMQAARVHAMWRSYSAGRKGDRATTTSCENSCPGLVAEPFLTCTDAPSAVSCALHFPHCSFRHRRSRPVS